MPVRQALALCDGTHNGRIARKVDVRSPLSVALQSRFHRLPRWRLDGILSQGFNAKLLSPDDPLPGQRRGTGLSILPTVDRGEGHTHEVGELRLGQTSGGSEPFDAERKVFRDTTSHHCHPNCTLRYANIPST